MPVWLQETIHELEVGPGYRYLKYTAGLIALVAMAVFYNAAAFRNLAAPEAMDAAQLARNLAEGRGYTTLFIRPLSLHLVFRTLTNKLADLQPDAEGRPRRPPSPQESKWIRLMHLEEPHPDLANAPLYPVLLAGWLKLMPYGYDASTATQSAPSYKPDRWISVFNQGLFVLAGVMLFGLARRLLDEPAAWLTVAVLFGAELFWRFTVSGLSTVLLVVLVLWLARLLAQLDSTARRSAVPSSTGPGHAPSEPSPTQPQPGQWRLWALAAATGAVVGLACLTRYAFGWLLLPVTLFVATVPDRRRARLALVCTATFAVVVAPWISRNLYLSRTPFGTASYAALAGTSMFPADTLERSLHPGFAVVSMAEYWQKLKTNARDLLQAELPRLGGSWVSAFFMVGLLVPFRNPTLSRLRWWLVGSLALFVVVQALGRTHLWTETPEVNADNLLVVFAPVAFLFGVALFLVLLDQLPLPTPAARASIVGLFWLVNSLPLILVYWAPPVSPLVYPPYYPAGIQDKASWLHNNDLCMTDLPWAMAWYGRRQSIWLTLQFRSQPEARWPEDFYQVHEQIKPVRGLYLSSRIMKALDSNAIWDWGWFAEEPAPKAGAGNPTHSVWRWQGGEATGDWTQFILQTLIQRQVPTGFPLRRAPRGLVPELFLTDSERGGG
jgi:hypothetical protein